MTYTWREPVYWPVKATHLQSGGRAALSAGEPEVAAVGEGDRVLADIRKMQKARVPLRLSTGWLTPNQQR